MADAIVSMAILTVDANRLGRDMLSRFEPMVLDRLYHSPNDVVSVTELAQAVLDDYGLAIPGAVIQTISRRAAREDLLVRENGVLRIDRDRLAKFDLSHVRAATGREYEALTVRGAEFAERTFGHTLTPEEFGSALWSFMQRNGAPLLATIVNAAPLPTDSNPDSPLDFIVASYIVDTQYADAVGFEQLAHVAKGAITASALYFPDSTEFETRLEGLTVYLDTTLLLRLVGASGPDLEELALDLLRLASGRGAQVACFEHTLREVRGVLAACTEVVRRGTSRYYGEASEYMVSTGWEVTDVVALSDALEDRLERLGVTVRVKPSHVESLTMDEDLLERTLQEHVHYTSAGARQKDLDSITSIYRLRNGRSATSLSRTRATFVTHNTALVRASRVFERLDDVDRGSIPLCIPDFALTTHLWVSQQVIAPDLPIRALVADSYSVMRADDHIWRLYLEKIESLKASRLVSDVDYVLLRQSLQVRSLIMFETHSDPEAFTEGSAQRVLEHARRVIQEEGRAEAEEARREAAQTKARAAETEAAAQRKADALAKALQDQEAGLSAVVERIAKGVSLTILAVLAAVSIVGAIAALPFVSSRGVGGIAGVVVAVCIFVYVVLSTVTMFFEVGLPSFFRALQSAVHSRVLSWYQRTAASGSDSANTPGRP